MWAWSIGPWWRLRGSAGAPARAKWAEVSQPLSLGGIGYLQRSGLTGLLEHNHRVSRRERREDLPTSGSVLGDGRRIQGIS